MKITKRGIPPDKQQKSINVLIYYAKEDSKSFTMLRKHFASDENIKIINLYDVSPGREWQKDRDEAIQSADCIILLISADFYGNDVVYEEAKLMTYRRKDLEDAGLILSIAVRPVAYKASSLILDGRLMNNEASTVNAVNKIKNILEGH